MTSLTLVRRIAARPAVVFGALTEPGSISQWWGPDAGPVLAAETDPRVGGLFRVRFRTLNGDEHESHGEYLEVDPPRKLAMTWQWAAGGDDDGISHLEFSLRPIEAGTELTLRHSKLSSVHSSDSHTEGWSGSLDKLAAMFGEGEQAAI